MRGKTTSLGAMATKSLARVDSRRQMFCSTVCAQNNISVYTALASSA